MVDFVNVLLRALMCMAFIVWVVRPMLMTFSRKEFDQAEIEEAAQMAIASAFQAYSNNNTNYYDNPQLAVFMAQNPDLPIPTDAELAQRRQAELEKAQADAAAAQEAANNPNAPAQTDADATVAAAPAEGEVAAGVAAESGADAAPTVAEGSELVASDGTVANGEEDGEEGEGETLEQMRERIKLEKKQKKPTIPPELLQNANSYEDQLMVVRMIVDQEQSRVASVIRSMIQVK
jgi:hypothetical protein